LKSASSALPSTVPLLLMPETRVPLTLGAGPSNFV
jgi:hypothetical protein